MAQTKTNKNHAGFVELKFRTAEPRPFGGPPSYNTDTLYKVFVAPSEDYLMMAVKNYCQKFGIFEAKAITKEEFEQKAKEINESNTQISL